jgi:hypothetical protein
MLSQQPVQHPVFSTGVYARNDAGADRLIAQIIHANGGRAAATKAPARTTVSAAR